MKRAIVCLLGGLTLAALAGPANAQRVTYPVDLVYEKLVDGSRPRKTIRVTMRAISAQAAETMCNSSMSMHRMSRNAIEKDPRPLGLTSDWYGVGGECVRNEDGNIEMSVEASSGGSN